MGTQYCFLFDECITPTLRSVAYEFDHYGFHVLHLDREGESDAALAVLARDKDYVVVTNNGIDFRALYKRFDLHPGLIVILPSVDREVQQQLFAAVCEALRDGPDIVNMLVEVDREANVTFSDWPPSLSNTPEI
jgi:predicted nuclease of predicted toxin-antitoxin system